MKVQRAWVLGIVGVLSIGVLGASGASSGGASKSNTPSAGGAASSGTAAAGGGASNDVVIATCAADDLGDLKATLTVTNNSSKRSDYLISVAFESTDGKTQLDTTSALVSSLEPGQNTSTDAVSFKKAPAGFTCRVTDINRFAST